MTFSTIRREAPPYGREFVLEAVHALGYFRSNAGPQLADIFERIWPRGLSAHALIYSDAEDMTAEEKEAAGTGKSRMPREIWDILSEKGRSDPHHAVSATTQRVIANTHRADFDAQEPAWSTFAHKVKFQATAQVAYHCTASLEIAGLEVRREDRFKLPMGGCRMEFCPCRWDYVIDDD